MDTPGGEQRAARLDPAVTGTGPAGLSAADLADYRQAQAEHDEEMRELADREFQIETGQINSYEEYRFSWQSEGDTPPQPPSAVPGKEADRRAWAGFEGEGCPPF